MRKIDRETLAILARNDNQEVGGYFQRGRPVTFKRLINAGYIVRSGDVWALTPDGRKQLESGEQA